MTTHAKLSPSSSKRWMTCPGSIGLVEKLNIKDKPSKFAAEGTVAHEIHEQCLIKELSPDIFLGKTMTADGFKFKVNQDMIDAVRESLDYIETRIEEAVDFGYRVKIKVEVRSSLKYLGIEGLDGGTADVILLFFNDDDACTEVEIIDYKHGQGVAVDVIHNTQAMSYALGVIMLKELNGHGIHEGVKLTISQPRAHHPDGRIRSWDTTKDELLNWEEDDLVPAALATQKDDAPLVPSDEGCRFCNASGQCPALYAKTQEVAIADFKEDKFPDPLTMTPEQKMVVMEHAAMIKSFIVAVEAQVQHEVDSGVMDYEDHYKLVRKTTHRKFIENGLEQLEEHLEEEDLYERKPIALGTIEKKLKKELGAKAAKEIMDEITNKPEGALVIAPISDRRKGVQPSLIGDFKNLDNEDL